MKAAATVHKMAAEKVGMKVLLTVGWRALLSADYWDAVWAACSEQRMVVQKDGRWAG